MSGCIKFVKEDFGIKKTVIEKEDHSVMVERVNLSRKYNNCGV